MTVACLVFSGSAFADDAKDTAAARAFGQDGVMLADQGKCAAAIEKLDRAEKLHHAPTTAGRLGECEIQTGKVIAGTERLQRLLREGLAPSPPRSFVTAMDRAQKVLDAALPRIATLRISVKAPVGTKPTVTVDDETISSALVGADIPTDPGAHKIVASAKGLVSDTKQLTLKDGETNGITLTLIVDPNYKPDPTPVAVTPVAGPAGPKEATPERKTNILPFVAFGVGAVGIGVGAVTGLIVGSKSSDLDKSCRPDGGCPSSQDSTLSSAKTMATVSTIGFIVGGAGIAAGVILLVTQGTTTTASRQRGVRPLVGLGYAGLDGTF
ncbi:hypothetical protein BH11MYX4_BH11MYX4_40250 [soil metagenome]